MTDTKRRRLLDSMSDRMLALSLLYQLYQIYDSGGISHGRSIRAGLLESFLSIGRQPKHRYDIDPATLLREVRRRLRDHSRKGIPIRLPGVYGNIERIPLSDFTCLALKHMIDWYRADKKQTGFMLMTEWDLVRSAFALLRGREVVMSYDIHQTRFEPAEMVEEGRRRFRNKVLRKPLRESDIPGPD